VIAGKKEPVKGKEKGACKKGLSRGGAREKSRLRGRGTSRLPSFGWGKSQGKGGNASGQGRKPARKGRCEGKKGTSEKDTLKT